MKANCKSLLLSIKISIIFFLLIMIFSLSWLFYGCDILEILLNISIGLFSSGCVALLLSIPTYKVSKVLLLEKYWNEAGRLLKKISTIDYLFVEYDSKALVSYLNEIKKEEWLREYNKIHNIKSNEKKYEDILIKNYIKNHPNIKKSFSGERLYKYAKDRIDKNVELIIRNSNDICNQYIKVSSESTLKLSFMLGDIQFFSGKKPYNRIYNNIYKPLLDIMNTIRIESRTLKECLKKESMDSIKIETILNLQKKMFRIDKNETKDFNNYVIHNAFLEKMFVNLENFRAEIYNIKPEKNSIYPPECISVNKNY